MTGPNIVVIGGGIAGMSAAYALSNHASQPAVTLIEAESALAHHTTGRSAAILVENLGTAPIKGLTQASLGYLYSPPEGLADRPFLEKRGVLSVTGPGRDTAFEQILAEGLALNPNTTEVDAAEAVRLFPPLRPDRLARAIFEPDAADIDVASLHQSFVRGTRMAGGTVATDHRALALERRGSGWLITTSQGEMTADLVVNAAGAWGDDVAKRAGIAPVGLQPLRRTAFMVPTGADVPTTAPLVADIEHDWYVKPDGTQLLCSPADETPSDPCDAKPEEIDIAMAIDAINTATTLAIRTVNSSWAGLRTFSPDRTMVIGVEPDDPTFIWCVGQGGTGIQTSPAAGQLVADLTLDGAPGPTFEGSGTNESLAELLPDRYR